MVPGAKRLLLHDRRQGLHDHSSACGSDYRPTDTFPNTASNPAAYAATNTTCHTWRTSGSIQLRCRCREYVGSGQKSMVLQDSYRGCPPTAPPPQVILPPVQQPIFQPAQPIFQPAPQPIVPARPADPYNCADGFANWQAGWSVPKKEWCCRVHGKGCLGGGGGFVTSSEPYDCNAGWANWMAGWSIPNKSWCCSNKGKGWPPAAGGCA